MKPSAKRICNSYLFQKRAISIKADLNPTTERAVPFLAAHKRRMPDSLARRDRIAGRRPVGDLLAEQAADQLDRGARGPTALVQEWIELDDVNRSYQSGIVQELHDQVRLAIGRSARHRGADARRDAGVEEIDAEADMQYPVARPHALDHAPDQHGNAELV